jgi:DNA-binding transcriptional MerR regulator
MSGQAEGADTVIPDKLFFRIGEAAELIGVETHVLRYWETEFKMRPQRSGSGQRMYRRKDIEKFLRIRHLLHEEGFTIAGARKSLQQATPGATQTMMAGGRVKDVLDRLGSVRKRIAEARRRFSPSSVAEGDLG